MMENKELLRVNDLEVSIGENIIKGISFSLSAKEKLGIFGESGSGKSVTMYTIMDLLSESADIKGQIILDGVDIRSLPENKRRQYIGSKIAMIFQDSINALNPYEKISAQMYRTIKKHHKLSKAELEKMLINSLEELDLDAKRVLRSFPHQLSGGMRQRVFIALTLLTEPKLIIADEPTTSLDVISQIKFIEFIKDLSEKKGLPLIFISHNLGLISRLCDKALVMSEGRIIESGKIKEIINSPSEEVTKDIVAETRKLYQAWDSEKEVSADNTKKEVLFSIKNLGKEYSDNIGNKKNKAIDDISIDILEGESTAIVGESGSGKSTLAMILSGLDKESFGNIYYKGSLIDGKDMEYKRQVQIVFQNPFDAFDPRLNILTSLLEPIRYYNIVPRKEEKEFILNILGACQIGEEVLVKKPTQLSGGQLQRIALARILSLKPKVLIADEIVTALDVSIQAKVLELLKNIQKKEKFSLIFISHDLAVVRNIAERIIVMKDGKIVEEGRTEDIYLRPSSEYTKELLKAIPIPQS